MPPGFTTLAIQLNPSVRARPLVPPPPAFGEQARAWLGRETGFGIPYAVWDERRWFSHKVTWEHGWPLPYLRRQTTVRGDVPGRESSPWSMDLGITAMSGIGLAADGLTVLTIVGLALYLFASRIPGAAAGR